MSYFRWPGQHYRFLISLIIITNECFRTRSRTLQLQRSTTVNVWKISLKSPFLQNNIYKMWHFSHISTMKYKCIRNKEHYRFLTTRVLLLVLDRIPSDQNLPGDIFPILVPLPLIILLYNTVLSIWWRNKSEKSISLSLGYLFFFLNPFDNTMQSDYSTVLESWVRFRSLGGAGSLHNRISNTGRFCQ